MDAKLHKITGENIGPIANVKDADVSIDVVRLSYKDGVFPFPLEEIQSRTITITGEFNIFENAHNRFLGGEVTDTFMVETDQAEIVFRPYDMEFGEKHSIIKGEPISSKRKPPMLQGATR